MDQTAAGRSQTWKGYVLVLTAATLWGTIGIFYSQIIGVYGLSPLSAVLARGVVACFILIAGLFVFRRDLLRIRRQDIPYFAVSGFITITLVFSFYVYAVTLVGVSVAAVLQYTAPAFVTIIAWRLFHEPLGRVKLVALALAMAGVVLIAQLYNPTGAQINPVGILCGLGAGLCFGLYSIFNKRSVRTYHPWTVTTYNFTFGFLFLALIQAPAALPAVLATPEAWPYIIAMAFFATVAAHGLYMHGLTHLPASNASIISTWEPATAMILAYGVLGETLAGPQIIGVAAILLGVILLSRKGT